MERLKNITVALFVVVFIASLCFNVRFCTMKQQPPSTAVSDTTRVTIIDTISYLEPKPKQEVFIENTIDRLPIAPQDENNTFVEITSDSVEVVIPITQKVYEDSTYTAYVSGYKPRLDSIFIYPRQEIITIHKIAKPKRWNVGIQVGYGVTVKEAPQFAPYIGIGISYNFFSF